VFCAILCDFTHLLVLLAADWKWEIPTSFYWLLGLTFPLTFLGVLNFGGVRMPTTPTHSGCATALAAVHRTSMKQLPSITESIDGNALAPYVASESEGRDEK